MSQKVKIVSIYIILIITQTSCSTIKRMEKNDNNLSEEKVTEKLCKVILFNDSHDVLFALSGAIRIGLNNKNVGKINRNEYIEVNLPKGKNELLLEHWDVFVFKSKHNIVFEKDTNYVLLKAKSTSNDFKILESKPDNFESNYKKED